MINGKTLLAIILARGGSKGIPKKNISILAGKPLINWTIEEAKKSKYIDRLILSSDDPEIIEIAKASGCEVPFVRPRELATDESPIIESILHAINTLPDKYDYILILQPTSPLRKINHIDAAINIIGNSDADSLASISLVEKSPYWMFYLNDKGKLNPLMGDIKSSNRQYLPDIYVCNGAIYIIKYDILKNKKTIIDTNTIGFIMEAQVSLDIDEEIDFKVAETILKSNME